MMHLQLRIHAMIAAGTMLCAAEQEHVALVQRHAAYMASNGSNPETCGVCDGCVNKNDVCKAWTKQTCANNNGLWCGAVQTCATCDTCVKNGNCKVNWAKWKCDQEGAQWCPPLATCDNCDTCVNRNQVCKPDRTQAKCEERDGQWCGSAGLSTEYVLSSGKDVPCELPITTIDECKAAALKLGWVWDYQRNWQDRLPGCHKTVNPADNHVNWNTVDGQGQNDDQIPICKRSSQITSESQGCTARGQYNKNQVPVCGCLSSVLPAGTNFCLNGKTFTVKKSWNTDCNGGSGATVNLVDETPNPSWSEGDAITVGSCPTS